MPINRRFMLKGMLGAACSVAAYPLTTTVTLAQGTALGEKRLVVVILRGAMDGLDAVRPTGDPLLAAYRPKLAAGGNPHDLDGFFALAAPLGGLMPLWKAGELGFVHATSTPYRDKRSHFAGQDLLEAGTGMDVPAGAVRDGWLNRMLQAVPGLAAETAYAVGREALPLLEGVAPAQSWTPGIQLQITAQNRLLLEHVYHGDALFRDSADRALTLAEELAADSTGDAADGMSPAAPPGPKEFAGFDRLIDFAAGRLQGETRIAAFSLSGWDTHRNQAVAITRPYAQLERMILRLRDQLGDVWGNTVVLAMTEFGRTAQENGSGGTDHGTAGVVVMAGGAMRGGKIYGTWPGLTEAALYDRRDLMPTSDVRDWAAWTMRGLYGFDRNMLEGKIFPGLDMGPDRRIIL